MPKIEVLGELYTLPTMQIAITNRGSNQIQPEIIKQMNTAQRSIWVAVAWFTDREIYHVLLRKAQQGVKVRLIALYDDINQEKGVDFDNLSRNGAEVYLTQDGNLLMHHKFCIIDSETVIMGSYNYTVAAQSQRESVIVSKYQTQVVNEFEAEFNDILREYFNKEEECPLFIPDVAIASSWKDKIHAEFKKEYFLNLVEFLKIEKASGQVIYPQGKLIFNAFEHCSFDDTKVVIIGQDPYHKAGQANGLCFSVANGIEVPPSLVNIFKEIQEDLGKPIPKSGNLERWATQGVLLLNATLTVRAGQAASHQNKGWEQFTDAVIQVLNEQKKNLVYMLWGSYAQKKGAIVDTSNNLVLTAKHPSPMAANYGGWFGNKHFSQANAYLKKQGLKEIDW